MKDKKRINKKASEFLNNVRKELIERNKTKQDSSSGSSGSSGSNENTKDDKPTAFGEGFF